jgi:hypothetical protein
MWIGVMLAVGGSLMCTSGMHGSAASTIIIEQFAIILCAAASIVDLRAQGKC